MTLRVYLVEDSPLVSERLRELMQEEGAMIVGQSDTAATAIADIESLRPDVVVVDIALREGTGFHVLKGIDDSFDGHAPARVVLTNFIREWYREAATRLGADYFFDKSNQIPEMLGVLRAMNTSAGVEHAVM